MLNEGDDAAIASGIGMVALTYVQGHIYMDFVYIQ